MKKIGSIKELRKICQNPRDLMGYPFYNRVVVRKASIYLTKVFLFFGASANFITLLDFIVGIIASLFFIFHSYVNILLGSLILQLWYLLDQCDGEVARYNKQQSISGIYIDRIKDSFIFSMIFVCISIGLFFKTGNFYFIIFGFIASLSTLILQLMYDTKYMANQMKSKKEVQKIKSVKSGVLAPVFDVLKKAGGAFYLPNIINVVLVFSIINKLDIMIFGYGIIYPLIILFTFIFNLRALRE